jgi:hypothetical protein
MLRMGGGGGGGAVDVFVNPRGTDMSPVVCEVPTPALDSSTVHPVCRPTDIYFIACAPQMEQDFQNFRLSPSCSLDFFMVGYKYCVG